MGHKYAEIMFTNGVKDIQHQKRSRSGYERMEQGQDGNYLLSYSESEFIGNRDSFYMASVGETGWPYVQHRGGPAGFMKVLDAKTIGFADFSGNRQYISTGNFTANDRVSIIFMDYPNQRRLKLIGHVEVIGQEHQAKLDLLKNSNYRARVERGFVIHVEAFDWNCPQHITPRFTPEEVEHIITERVSLALAKQQSVKAAVSEIGEGPLSVVISGITQLTPLIRKYELKSKNGKHLPTFAAGSHIGVPVRLPEGKTLLRHYSICSNPARRDRYEIAVLNELDGKRGASAIHESFELGTIINCELPETYFGLHKSPTQPIVLIAGGIGITPMLSMGLSLSTITKRV